MRRALIALVGVFVLALPPVPLQAAVTFIDSDYTTQTQGVGGNTLALTVTAAAGDAICACGLRDSGTSTVTISDDDGSTYTHLAQTTVSSLAQRMACAINVTASGGAVVVTADWGAAEYRGLFVQVFRGVATASAIEDSDSGTGTGAGPTTASTPALTLSGTGMVSACLQYDGAQAVAPISPLISDREDESYTNVSGAMSYGPYSKATVTPTWTIAGAANWGAQAFALLESPVVSSTKRCLIVGVGKC